MTKKALLVLISFCFMQSVGWADKGHLLITNKDAMQARIDLIQKGKEILVEYYSIADDDVSLGFFGALVQAAHRGADVKIMVDALSSKTSSETIAALLDMGQKNGKSNFQIKVFNSFKWINPFGLTNRTHAKIVLIDGKELITGGRNIADDYFGLSDGRNFIDVDAYTSGDAAAKTRENFMELWNSAIVTAPTLGHLNPDVINQECGGGESGCNPSQRADQFEKLQRRKKELYDKISKVLNEGFGLGVKMENRGTDWLNQSADYQASVIIDEPRNFVTGENLSRGIGEKYLETLSRAKKSLTIVSPYMVPNDEHYQFFKALLARKVKIKLITNSILSSDDMRSVAAYYTQKEKLIALGEGLEIYEFDGPQTLHAKLALLDDDIGVVGTFNFDPRSYRLNREMALVFEAKDSKALMSELSDEIVHLQSRSLLVGKDGVAQNLKMQSERAVPENRVKAVEKYKKWIKRITNQFLYDQL